MSKEPLRHCHMAYSLNADPFDQERQSRCDAQHCGNPPMPPKQKVTADECQGNDTPIERRQLGHPKLQASGADGLDLTKKHMQAEPDRKIKNDANHGSRDRSESTAKSRLRDDPLDVWRPGEYPQEGFLLVKVKGEEFSWDYVDIGWKTRFE